MAKYILTIELMQGNDNYHGCHSLTKSWVPVCRSLCIFERKCRELNPKKIFCSQFMAVLLFSLLFEKKCRDLKLEVIGMNKCHFLNESDAEDAIEKYLQGHATWPAWDVFHNTTARFAS